MPLVKCALSRMQFTLCYLIVEVVLLREEMKSWVHGQAGHLWNLVVLAHEVVETPVGVCEYCVHVSACRYMRHDSILTLTSCEGV